MIGRPFGGCLKPGWPTRARAMWEVRAPTGLKRPLAFDGSWPRAESRVSVRRLTLGSMTPPAKVSLQRSKGKAGIGQVQSVTNVCFAAAYRPHLRCNGGEVAIGRLLVNTRRRLHAGLKRLQRRPAISCTGGGAPDRQPCAGPCQRLNSPYWPHIVTSVKQGNSAACCTSCHTPAQCKSGAASRPP